MCVRLDFSSHTLLRVPSIVLPGAPLAFSSTQGFLWSGVHQGLLRVSPILITLVSMGVVAPIVQTKYGCHAL